MKKFVVLSILFTLTAFANSINMNLLNQNVPIKLTSYIETLSESEQKREMTDSDEVAFYIVTISEMCHNINIKLPYFTQGNPKDNTMKIIDANKFFINHVKNDTYGKLLDTAKKLGKTCPHKNLIIEIATIIDYIESEFYYLLHGGNEVYEITPSGKTINKFTELNKKTLGLSKQLITKLVQRGLVAEIKDGAEVK